MADEQTLVPEQSEEEALRAAQAGYDKTRGGEPPVDLAATASSGQPLAETTEPEDHIPGESVLTADPEPQPDPTALMTEQLAAMRAQLQELKDQGVPAAEMRRMYGEIGNINRSLQQLQAAKAVSQAEAPAADDVAAALAEAEEVAKEFPEIAGPLVKVLRAQARAAAAMQAAPAQFTPEPQQPWVPETPQIDVEAERQRARQQAAIEAIDELHPDRHQLKESPEFKAWFAGKTPAYQQRVLTTWNPAVLSQCFSEFKASRTARQRRQDRLEAAVVPQGTGAGGGSSVLPDEQGAWVGYNKSAKRA